MLGSVALIALATLGPAEIYGATPSVASLPPLRVQGATLARNEGSVTLRSPLLEAATTFSRAPSQRGAQAGGANAGATGSATTGGDATASAGASTEGSTTPPAEGSTDTAAAPAAEEPEPDIELMRHRAQLTRIHRPLGISTWATYLATMTLGTISAINQRTLFGSGLCNGTAAAPAAPIFGQQFGCDGLGAVHGIFAFATVSLYATTGIFALAMPDPERAMAGNDARGARLRIHRAMAYIHFASMVLMPILGVLAANPAALGITSTSSGAGAVRDYGAVMRTIHLGVGYIGFAALTTAMIVELL